MKGLEKVLLVAIFVVPVVVCTIVLRNIWSDDTEENKDSEKNGDSIIVDISDPYIDSGSQGQEDEESGEILQMGGESFENKLGDPISKIYEDATISAAVTNVYSESKETSEIVGKLEKYTTVTAQKFEQGWSRVTGIDASGIKISGWTKTINVSYPDNSSLSTSTNTKTGVVTAEPYLNVRLNPNTTATILTTVNKGVTVTIEDSASGWYKITVNGVTGWVSADYVK